MLSPNALPPNLASFINIFCKICHDQSIIVEILGLHEPSSLHMFMCSYGSIGSCITKKKVICINSSGGVEGGYVWGHVWVYLYTPVVFLYDCSNLSICATSIPYTCITNFDLWINYYFTIINGRYVILLPKIIVKMEPMPQVKPKPENLVFKLSRSKNIHRFVRLKRNICNLCFVLCVVFQNPFHLASVKFDI